jgi:acyl-coenzyme A synthetase/AMP-(fatty) acid ligase
VIGGPDGLLGELIIAFVVPAAGVELTAQKVQRHCHAQLPRFKLPKQVHFVNSLPHTDTGKLRRRELVERWLREHGTGV